MLSRYGKASGLMWRRACLQRRACRLTSIPMGVGLACSRWNAAGPWCCGSYREKLFPSNVLDGGTARGGGRHGRPGRGDPQRLYPGAERLEAQRDRRLGRAAGRQPQGTHGRTDGRLGSPNADGVASTRLQLKRLHRSRSQKTHYARSHGRKCMICLQDRQNLIGGVG